MMIAFPRNEVGLFLEPHHSQPSPMNEWRVVLEPRQVFHFPPKQSCFSWKIHDAVCKSWSSMNGRNTKCSSPIGLTSVNCRCRLPFPEGVIREDEGCIPVANCHFAWLRSQRHSNGCGNGLFVISFGHFSVSKLISRKVLNRLWCSSGYTVE